MNYDFSFRPYRRRFVQPLQTNHGIWEVRDGIIVRLRSPMGKIGLGEIAPISWFGSESFATALEFCEQLPTTVDAADILEICDRLPACQFGFESALAMVEGKLAEISEIPALIPRFRLSGLLPAGDRALVGWENLWQQGYRTFKWKIGVYPLADELAIWQELLAKMPENALLRLDGNGGLDYDSANLWLYTCDMHRAQCPNLAQVEYIEQPLPVREFDGMLELSACYATPIALDESIANLEQLQSCYENGWRGIYTIKPGIIGSPRKLRQICYAYNLDMVFSSTLETVIGRTAALQLANEMSSKTRSLGFGVSHWFADDEVTWLDSLWQD